MFLKDDETYVKPLINEDSQEEWLKILKKTTFNQLLVNE